MPSSLRTVLSSALGFAPHPPVSVLVRIRCLPPQLFSALPPRTSATNRPRPDESGNPHVLSWAAAWKNALRIDRTTEGRSINLLSIDYAFQPRLRIRLTLGGFTVPRKPWVFGEQDSHLLYRYSFRHNHFQVVQVSSPSPFTRLERSPTPAWIQRIHTSRSFGCTLEPRSFSAQSLSTSELLRTL